MVPVGICGTVDILPPGHRLPRLKRVEVNFGEPLYFDGNGTHDPDREARRQVVDEAMDRVAELAEASGL